MRNYKKKTERTSLPKDVMDSAAELVVKKGESVRKVANQFQINHCTLFRYCKKVKVALESDPEKAIGEGISVGYAKPSKVLNETEERELVDYIVTASKTSYGLSPREIRTLAFEYCIKNNKKVPPSWNEKKIAGFDWFTKFLRTYQHLSLCIPKATSLARTTRFNVRMGHFEPSVFEVKKADGKKKLKWDGIPTIYSHSDLSRPGACIQGMMENKKTMTDSSLEESVKDDLPAQSTDVDYKISVDDQPVPDFDLHVEDFEETLVKEENMDSDDNALSVAKVEQVYDYEKHLNDNSLNADMHEENMKNNVEKNTFDLKEELELPFDWPEIKAEILAPGSDCNPFNSHMDQKLTDFTSERDIPEVGEEPQDEMPDTQIGADSNFTDLPWGATDLCSPIAGNHKQNMHPCPVMLFKSLCSEPTGHCLQNEAEVKDEAFTQPALSIVDNCLVCNAPCYFTKSKIIPTSSLCKKCKEAYFYQLSQEYNGKKVWRLKCLVGGRYEVDCRKQKQCPPCHHKKIRAILKAGRLALKNSRTKGLKDSLNSCPSETSDEKY